LRQIVKKKSVSEITINFTFNRYGYFKFKQYNVLTECDKTTEKVSVFLYLQTMVQAWGFRSFGLPGGVLYIPDVSEERTILVFKGQTVLEASQRYLPPKRTHSLTLPFSMTT
jgi:hypothetical protein